jgi:glycosyltransferase involved in cell wall biosynthesis
MYEIPTAFLHFDTPGPGQNLTAGRIILQGWLVPKPGSSYTDLRVVAGPEVFAGVFGFPRPDLADHFKSDRPCLLAGFEIAVFLAAGRHRLQLEGCALSGNWETLESLDLQVDSSQNASSAAGSPTILTTEAGEALRILLRRTGTGGLSLPAAAAAVVHAAPRPRYLRHPHRPFHGHLDEPQSWARSVFGRVAIAGWIFHESMLIKRVFATTDLQAVQNLRFGRETPFLAGLHPDFPLALRCGFDGFIDLPAQLPQPVTVRVYVELADGTWHLGSVVRFAATDHEFAKQPLGRFSPMAFWRASRALVRAIKAGGMLVESGPAYWREIGQVWREYSAQAGRPPTINAPVRPSLSDGSGPQKIGRIHLFTHNLSREGAPLFLLELARHLRGEAGASLSVTSGQEGPLRREYESLGATVQVVDPAPLLDPANARGLRQALAAAAAQIELEDAGLVIANTLSAYWGVHLARRAGRPVLYYIHESTSPRSFFRGHMPPGALASVEESFRLADRVSFLTPTTQQYYNALSDQSNYCVNPGWIDLAGIDRFRATHQRDTLRAQLGLAPGKKLVVNLGTVCDRKGQHLFARAVDLLGRTAPALAASAEFLMVGGRDTAYDRALADFLLELNRPNLRIVPETDDAYRYYGAADLFVCSSYEESFPRVVLEAMAFELPIVSTGVHGIPELVRPDVEAVLVRAGDSWALASAMQRMLQSPDTGKTLAARARARVAAEFDSRVMLPRHEALARRLAAIRP